MIDAIDVNIIDVEQQRAICARQYIEQKFNLRHLLAWGAVVRHVLDRDLLAQDVLYLLNSVTDVFDGLLRKRKGQEVIQVAGIAAVAQMLAVANRPVLLQKPPNLVDKINI